LAAVTGAARADMLNAMTINLGAISLLLERNAGNVSIIEV
jgi:hypothetical protein